MTTRRKSAQKAVCNSSEEMPAPRTDAEENSTLNTIVTKRREKKAPCLSRSPRSPAVSVVVLEGILNQLCVDDLCKKDTVGLDSDQNALDNNVESNQDQVVTYDHSVDTNLDHILHEINHKYSKSNIDKSASSFDIYEFNHIWDIFSQYNWIKDTFINHTIYAPKATFAALNLNGYNGAILEGKDFFTSEADVLTYVHTQLKARGYNIDVDLLHYHPYTSTKESTCQPSLPTVGLKSPAIDRQDRDELNLTHLKLPKEPLFEAHDPASNLERLAADTSWHSPILSDGASDNMNYIAADWSPLTLSEGDFMNKTPSPSSAPVDNTITNCDATEALLDTSDTSSSSQSSSTRRLRSMKTKEAFLTLPEKNSSIKSTFKTLVESASKDGMAWSSPIRMLSPMSTTPSSVEPTNINVQNSDSENHNDNNLNLNKDVFENMSTLPGSSEHSLETNRTDNSTSAVEETVTTKQDTCMSTANDLSLIEAPFPDPKEFESKAEILHRLSIAVTRLRPGWRPPSSISRSEDLCWLVDRMRLAISANRGGTVHVCGSAGRGKTCTTEAAMDIVRAEMCEPSGRPQRCQFLWLNGASLQAGDVYRRILQYLGNESNLSEWDARSLIWNEWFPTKYPVSMNTPITILVIDEIDQGPAKVIQDLLCAASFTNSKVLLIGIANLVLLHKKLRLDESVIHDLRVFREYSALELTAIIESRVPQLFDSSALRFCSSKCIATGKISNILYVRVTMNYFYVIKS